MFDLFANAGQRASAMPAVALVFCAGPLTEPSEREPIGRIASIGPACVHRRARAA
jgi:hypothetical protein